jgi:hypothetical protein
MPVWLPGDAKNCQLPSSNTQNTTSRHSPILKIIDNPALRSPVVLAGRPSCKERRRRASDYARVDPSLPQKHWSWYSKKALTTSPSGLPQK